MAKERVTPYSGHWLLTFAWTLEGRYQTQTLGTPMNPATWLAQNGPAYAKRNDLGRPMVSIVFAMPISVARYEAMKDAGYA